MSGVKGYYSIDTVVNDYYTYTRYEDSTMRIPYMRDTIWLQQKAYTPLERKLYEMVASKSELTELENSKEKDYALVYFYAPADANYRDVVKQFYLKNAPFGFIVSGMTFVFKVQKEGRYAFLSHLNDQTSFNMNVTFGENYFVKATFSGLVKEPKVNFKLMEVNKGREGYAETVLYERDATTD